MFRIFILTVFVCLVAGDWDQSRLEFLRDLLKEVRSLGEVEKRLPTFMDGAQDELRENYRKVNNGELEWFTAEYEGIQIRAGPTGPTGVGYEAVLDLFKDDMRMYVYGVLNCGGDHEREKLFLTWIGPEISPLRKAKVSTDKAFVQAIITGGWRKELLAEEVDEARKSLICRRLVEAANAGYNKF